MFNKILILLLMVLPIPATANAADAASPEQVVAEFQKLPHNEMFCLNDKWSDRAKLVGIEKEFSAYFSKELYKLFMWTECVEPNTPLHYGDIRTDFSYDVRFSIPYSDLLLEKTYLAKDIHIRLIKNQGRDKAIVNVNSNYLGTKMFTSYTLIRENGQWKIDDIAPQADYVKGSDMDTFDHSDSIKADMQGFYRAAVERYKQEQARKH